MSDTKFGYLLAETEDEEVSALISRLVFLNAQLQIADADSVMASIPAHRTQTELDAMTPPREGVFYYNSVTRTMQFYDGSQWVVLAVVPTPAAPSALTAHATASFTTKIDLAWTSNSASSELGFKIDRKAGLAGTWAEIAEVGTNVVTFQDTGLTSGQLYYYRVRAFGSGGTSAYSNQAADQTNVTPVDPDGVATLIRGYKYPSLSALSNNDPIASWADVSTSADPAVQATAGFKPLYKTGQQNGKATGRLDGSDDRLGFTRVTNVRTIVVAVKHRTGSQDFAALLGDATSFHFHGGAGNKMFDGTSTSSNVLNGTARINGFNESPINVLKSTNVRVFVFTTTGNIELNRIGSDRDTSGRFWDGDYYYIYLYSSVLSDANIKGIIQFVKDDLALTETSVLAPLAVLDGDSLTASASYQVRITNCLAGNCAAGSPLTAPYIVNDFGVSGQTVVNCNSDAATQVDPLADGLREKNIYVLWAGNNDLYLDSAVAAQTVFTNLMSGVTTRRAAGYTRVVLPTVTPRDPARTVGVPGNYETRRVQLNTLLKSAANQAQYGYKCADLTANSSLEDATNATIYSDGTHLTDAGYDLACPLIYAQMVV